MSQIQLSPSQLVKRLENTLKAGLVPYIQGSPGIGKSDIVRQVAKKYNLLVKDFRLSSAMPEDFNGLPMRNDNGRAAFTPFMNFPIEGDEIPEGYDGFLLFFDEISSGNRSIQAACYKVMLDRMIGEHKLHENCAIIAAGNKETDNAVVHSMSTALESRLVHFNLKVDNNEWLDWAYSSKIHPLVTGYIAYKPSALYEFDPDSDNRTFQCPRTWEFASRMLHVNDDVRNDSTGVLHNISGCISDGPAVEFLSFCDMTKDTPRIEDIINDPKGTKVPKQAGVQYFMMNVLSDHVNDNTFEPIMDYVERYDEEFQIIYLRSVLRKKPQYVKKKRFKTILDSVHKFMES